MKKNVLIFGGGSYSALQIYNSLKDCLRFKPILASSTDNHSVFVCKEAITSLPYDSHPEFIDALNKCIEENDIEFIIPTHDTAAFRVMENEHRINAKIVCSPLETAKICRYKSLTYKMLQGLEFVPQIYNINDEDISFPVFAKDDVGQGGRNAFVIRNRADFSKLNNDIDYIICEYLSGDEITIDCFTDRYGELRFVQPRTRQRILNGISARSQNIELTDEILNIARKISERIKFRGYWFIQCKKDNAGRYKLMEISTRFAGTFAVSRNLDVNLPLLALCDFDNMDIDIVPNKYKIVADKIYIDRYKVDYNYERVYIDFDDTIVFERTRYNLDMMKFIYQCINQKKELVLITKHMYDIYETMDNLRLNKELFDEIIQVPVSENKCDYIDISKPCIFIDNAYAERKKVKEKCNIPTFDVSNVECLIDWRN